MLCDHDCSISGNKLPLKCSAFFLILSTDNHFIYGYLVTNDLFLEMPSTLKVISLVRLHIYYRWLLDWHWQYSPQYCLVINMTNKTKEELQKLISAEMKTISDERKMNNKSEITYTTSNMRNLFAFNICFLYSHNAYLPYQHISHLPHQPSALKPFSMLDLKDL